MSFKAFIDGLNDIGLVLGGPLMVALFYWFRFLTLKGTSSYTTRKRFYAGVVAFITPFVLIYAILPERMSPLVAVWVVIFVWLIPVLPVAWRNVCQSLVEIPSHAFNLRNTLAAASFKVRPEDFPILARRLGRCGYQIEDFRAVQAAPIQSRFLKIAAIMLHLEQWSAKRESFIERNSEHYSDLLQVFDLLSFKVTRVLKNTAAIYGAIMEESHVEPDDWHALESLTTEDRPTNRLQLAAQTAAGGMLEDLRKDMDFMLDNLLLFVARAALAGELNYAGRKRRLEAIGFAVTAPAPNVMWAVMVAVAVTISWSMVWLVMLNDVIHMPGDHKNFGYLRIFVVSPMYFIASFGLVHYLKRSYAFANEGIFGQAPVGFILSAGLMTALLVFPLQAYFDYNQFHEQAFLHVLINDLPMLLYPWASATMAAVLVQDSTWRSFEPGRTRRIMDGITFGIGMTLASLMVWMIHRRYDVPAMEILNDASPPVLFFGLFVTSFAFGFVMGYLVMALIRESSSSSVADKRIPSDSALIRA
jgi:hypothetical protein